MSIRTIRSCFTALFTTLALIAFCAVATPVSARADTITTDRAKEIALGQTGGGNVVDMSRKYGGHGYYYWVQIVKGGEYHTVEIDVNSGDVLKYVNKSRDKSKVDVVIPPPPVGTVGLTHDQALEQALKMTNGGTVLESKLHGKKKGRLIYEFEIVNSGTKYEIEIDAATGNVLDFERH